jgi:predicted small lipoprotein YifL
MNINFFQITSLLLLSFALAACGQSGKLYLPNAEPQSPSIISSDNNGSSS